MKAFKCAAVICCSLAACINSETANGQGVIINGGFESPAIAPNSNRDVEPTGWTRIASPTGFITHLFNGNGGIPNEPVAHTGSQHFLLGYSGSGIFQNITIVEPDLFHLEWWTATDLTESQIPMTYNVRIWNNENSLIVAENEFEAQLGFDWFSGTMETHLEPGSYKIEFRTTDFSNGGWIFLDDVSMVAVPEPGTVPLGMLGLLVLMRSFCASEKDNGTKRLHHGKSARAGGGVNRR